MEELIALLKFAIVNEDKFTEWDPDLVKRQWIEAAKKAVEAAQQGALPNDCEIDPETLPGRYADDHAMKKHKAEWSLNNGGTKPR